MGERDQDQPKPFQPGDIVYLKSNPELKMTVERCKGDKTECVYVHEGMVYEHKFEHGALTK